MGGLFIYRSVSVNKMVVRIFTSNIADFHALGNLCLGRASRRPQLETARCVSAIVPADIALLVLWWATAFSAIGWMLAEASTPPKVHMFSGIYAERDIPRFIRTTEYLLPGSSIVK